MLSEPSPTSPKPTWKILLVDDHPVTRHGMRALIEREPDFVICAETDTSADSLAAAESLRPDLAIVDIALRQENGLDLVQQLKAAHPALPILVVSMHDEDFYATRARRAGAAGYVMKQHASDRILGALRQIAAGETAFASPSTAAKPATRRLPSPPPPSGLDALSARETEVLQLLGDGFGSREIAEKLGLSVKTIETYREHLKLKLDLPTGERLTQFAIRWGSSRAKSP
jgi:DNA-binding NarL/FixJ family response regulator